MAKSKKEQKNDIDHTEKSNSISYHNKDIVSKIFGENLKDRSFAAYGLKIPKIVEVLPTNLPAIEANELRMDNLFRLEDRTLALVDYESTYSYEDKIKYLNYIVRTLKRNWKEGGIDQPIRMIVIYTGNIKRDSTQPQLDVGCLQFTVEEIFLSELNAPEIEYNLKEKLNQGYSLEEEEEMQMILLPLIYDNIKEQKKCIRRCIELIKTIKDEKKQIFLLCGLMVFTDKIIEEKDSKEIKRRINMTKVGRLIQEEIDQAEETGRRECGREIAERMKEQGISINQILKCIQGITREELESMK